MATPRCERRRLRPGAALLIAALVATIISPHASWAEEVTVKIDNFTFDPPRLTVKPGTTVIWRNEDDIPHAIAAANLAFKSKALDTDDSYAFTFKDAGTYEYFCSLHPHMVGTVVVEAKAAAQ